jgi:hypothetical protein
MKFQLIKNKETKGELNKLPSKTLPDQTLSIPELIKRYAQGLPLGAPAVGHYEENPEEDILNGRNWNTLDLSEKANFIQAAKEEYHEINKRVNKKKSNTSKQGEAGDVPPQQ